MRVVIQRVQQASVSINNDVQGSIEQGMLIFVGIEHADTQADVEWLTKKICGLRIFADSKGKMNHNLQVVGGGILVISQFTLHASTKKGNRPSYIQAARPEQAIPLYEAFVDQLRSQNIHVETGVFAANMQVSLMNDGPVTIIIDSKQRE